MTLKITKDTENDHFNLHVQVHPVSAEYCLSNLCEMYRRIFIQC